MPGPAGGGTTVIGLVSRIALIATLGMPSLAWGHAQLAKSVPARRAVLSRPPVQAQLWFTERLESAFSRLSVWDRSGAQVDLRDAHVGPDDPRQLSVSLPALAPGTYVVKFRALSVDGHVVEGEFPFTIRQP
jgi:methionine-rich copper-binding protein CopC